MAPTKEIKDPIEEIVFQVVQASGQSEYRRGIPASPRKCCGKNVRLTPINIIKNCTFDHKGCRPVPENSGNQWVNPAKIANTAPMDSTQWKWATTQ